TLGALSATGNAKYQQGFAAPAEGFETIPFGDAEALREAVTRRPDHFAAFIVEPIQGEGGIVEPPPGYLKAVREICTAAGVLLVFDEIQTGLGRTGRLFACEREGVAPDVMTLAKALGGGLLPIGAVLCTPAAYTEAFALKHSSTFAGNALACRAGLAVMDRLTRGDGALLRRVRRNGARLKRGLLRLKSLYPHLLAEVRGRGYMLGLRFHADRARWPDGLLGVAADQDFFTPIFASYLLNVEGIRVAPTLNGNSVIRIEPALNFTRAQCERLLDGLGRALEAFSEGDAGRVFGSILDGEPRPRSIRIDKATTGGPDGAARVEPEQDERRFAFLVHPLDVHGYTEFDPSLASLTEGELADVTARISG
ncbi:MAG TPA: aminotransferase class III-fold pyridoxal phosphate-dependent enzyme, partial [Planctomycetaceae bacterium]